MTELPEIKIKKLREGAALPARATPGSAGCDLFACIDAPLVLPARGRVIVPTGIAIALDRPDAAAFVFGRSGLGIKHGIVPSNGVGVIDSDYRGEILVGLSNHSEEDYAIQPGERIAQLVVMPVFLPRLVEAEELSDTGRGTGGLGSTGRG